MSFMSRSRLVSLLAGALLILTSVVFAQEKDTAKEDTEDTDKKEEKKKDLPLDPERKIEFTTNEGTWISLDVSPDGKTIKKLWPEEKELPALWWWNDTPAAQPGVMSQ